MPQLRIAVLLVLAAAAATVHAHPSRFPQGLRRRLNKNALMSLEALSDQARKKATSVLENLAVTPKDDVRLNPATGQPFISDEFTVPEVTEEARAARRRHRRDLFSEMQPTGYSSTGVPHFHSKPGAPNVVYLDFDGYVNPDNAWGSFSARPFDLDGNEASFNADELYEIVDVWRRVAEDYAPFDIDITTEEPASFGSRVGRCLITQTRQTDNSFMPSYNAGGVAYVDVFASGASTMAFYSPALVFADNLANWGPYISEAASHEIGHNMGLLHDGTSTDSYYDGLGNSGDALSYGPIMGAVYGMSCVFGWRWGKDLGAHGLRCKDARPLMLMLMLMSVQDDAVEQGRVPRRQQPGGRHCHSQGKAQPASRRGWRQHGLGSHAPAQRAVLLCHGHHFVRDGCGLLAALGRLEWAHCGLCDAVGLGQRQHGRAQPQGQAVAV
jgi:hypothetical protein